MISRQGKKILFNGQETQIFGRSSFKALAHLRHNNDAGFLNWIEHNQKLGFNLLRVLGETEYWEDHPMWGSPPKLRNVWNRGELESGNRPTGLTTLNKSIIQRMFKYSEETGMAFEYVVDATLKHADPAIPWGTIGHCVRQTLAFMRTVQSQYLNALVMVNFHNEWDAHSSRSWHADGLDRAGALQEVNKQAMRARRWVNGPKRAISYKSPGPGWAPEQWPEALILVDHGGRNEIQYQADNAPDSYDLITLHPTRHGEWWKLVDAGVFDRYLRSELPVYFSESKMWVDPEDRDRAMKWYPHTDGWTTDWSKYEHWMNSAKEKGLHFVVHDEKGVQSCADFPRVQTMLEARLKPGPPPPPPPPPECKVYKTGKDALGRFNVKVEFPNQPAEISQGVDFTQKVKVSLGEKAHIYRVDSFNGLDRGDIVEMDTFVYDGVGRVLYQRSLHKEVQALFDSFHPLPCEAFTETVDIHMHAHVTDPKEHARAHWNIMLWCHTPNGGNSTPNGGNNGGSEEFLTMVRAEKEAQWTGANMHLWAGVYDPNYVVGHCKWALEGKPFNMTESEMRQFSSDYLETTFDGDSLIRKLRREHPNFPGRSVVTKAEFEAFKSELTRLNRIAEDLRASTEGWPGKGTHYDSIKGFCEYCNRHGIREK